MTAQPLIFHSTGDGVLVAPPYCGLLTVPDFLRQVQLWCATGGTALVVDLSEVRVFEDGAFRALVWARRYCMSRGVRLAMVEPAPGVLRTHELAVLRSLLPLQRDAGGSPSTPAPVMRPAAGQLAG